MQKIFKALSFLTISIVFISSVLISGWTSANALSLEEDSGNNPLKIVIEGPEESQERINSQEDGDGMSMQDIFGSEQVFPFEAGFGGKSAEN